MKEKEREMSTAQQEQIAALGLQGDAAAAWKRNKAGKATRKELLMRDRFNKIMRTEQGDEEQ